MRTKEETLQPNRARRRHFN